jgi:hypothetical protein
MGAKRVSTQGVRVSQGNAIEVTNASDAVVFSVDSTGALGKVANLTTTGDILYASSANTPARLGIGTSSQVLTVAGGVPTWATPTVGDITAVTAGTGISGGGTSGDVTITNSMATAIDAKGDLVAGTGADTFARLAVGANGTVLTADSVEATGLKWAAPASGTWTSWTPSWTGLTVGNGTVIAEYLDVNNTVFIFVNLTFGSTTSISGDVLMSIPVNMETPLTGVRMGNAVCYDATSSSILANIQSSTASQVRFRYIVDTGSNTIRDNDLFSNLPFTWTTDDQLITSFWYRKDI